MSVNAAKVAEARDIIDQCIGKNGVWASTSRYKYQCWTRDFVIAVEDVLLNDGREEIVRNHLRALAKRQKPNGQIPIMFLDDTPRWLWIKIKNSIRERRMSFLLRAYLSREGVGGLSTWTRDSELLFVLGVMKYLKKTNDQRFVLELAENLEKAFAYIESHLVVDGLVYGGDWRDTRPDL